MVGICWWEWASHVVLVVKKTKKKKKPPANAGDLRGQWRSYKRLGFDASVRKIAWSRKWKPTPEFMDRGDWQATVSGVAKTQPRLSACYQGEQCSLSHTRGKVILGLYFCPLKSTLKLLHRIFEKRKWEITKGVWHNAYQSGEREVGCSHMQYLAKEDQQELSRA